MNEFDVQIIVPHGRTVRQIFVDGQPATHHVTQTIPGVGYAVETWSVMLVAPPVEVLTHFVPVQEPRK